MREIKFRAWHKDEMHYKIEKHHVEHNALSGRNGDVWDFSDWLKYSDVMQYTGLKDDNGAEIYEGDILATLEDDVVIYSDTVEWIEDGFFIGVWRLSQQIDNGITSKEIIGNVHQNPDLLEEK